MIHASVTDERGAVGNVNLYIEHKRWTTQNNRLATKALQYKADGPDGEAGGEMSSEPLPELNREYTNTRH